MRTPSLRLAALAVGALLAVSACSPDPDADAPSMLDEPVETSEPYVIEPLDAINGSTPWTSDGVTLLVPAGYEATSSTSQGIATTEFHDGDEVALTLAVAEAREAADGDVYLSARVTEAEITAEGGDGIVLSPAELEGWATAYAVRGTQDPTATDADATGGVVDVVAVTARDDAGSILVTATAHAPEGTFEGSPGEQMLRTMRPAP
ncbi:hypothetical protein CLV28_0394 [Sediminihabitans luteus]|uniref:Lipoprotein LpqN n=1 Tax=Sediminihabitans luteus TaxID=1138585 RepID=A0A2M9CZ50_9CELL|nr:hypothetical protein [Sediminihabitans luteus]PJJ77180.1 hypothetical protein CLV28_0394 [Sediminihabitans luteus]GII98628.1 hypothetical protein Slu03_10060 [Sediminihabitans luteus]